jgi:ssDNA-binding Zn-finger/Zn-ribbon topoisomerase 1
MVYEEQKISGGDGKETLQKIKEEEMNCPNCGKRMRVKDSRCTGEKTYRRYLCSCGEKMYTEEKPEQEARLKLSRSYYT